ncbi:GNAT family N-acetyltransferase [Actinopolymorpha rutila]
MGAMPDLVTPTPAVRVSFLQAMQEFLTEGRGTVEDNSMIGREFREYAAVWSTPDGFAAYVADLRAAGREETPRPNGFVPSTTLWYVDGEEYLGRLAIRHRLTPFLLEVGGHIGYDVRPSARRRGHATAMLAAALPTSRHLGIDPVLVTCDTDNVGSRKVIEGNGGVLEDERNGKLRYWVPTSGS